MRIVIIDSLTIIDRISISQRCILETFSIKFYRKATLCIKSPECCNLCQTHTVFLQIPPDIGANTRIINPDPDFPLPAAPAPQLSHKYEPVPFNAQTINHQQYSDPFNKLLTDINDPTIADNQKQRLKIAFAEGYLTATHPDNANRSGKAMRYLKVLQQLLIIVVFIGIFISLFVSTNGSVFRSAIKFAFLLSLPTT